MRLTLLIVCFWLGLDYETIIQQCNNVDEYQRMAQSLVREGFAREENGAIISNPIDVPDFWVDEIAGEIPISQDDKGHINKGIVLIKSDGMATYHWSCVVDDWNYEINFVIRGHDHITNTSRQIALYKMLDAVSPSGAPIPKYAHVGLIHFQGKKLSKRDGAASVLEYASKHYDPDALLNFMARLGWGPRVDDKTTKLLPRERMLELFFEGGKMRSQSANMDLAKLDSFDRKYKARKKNATL